MKTQQQINFVTEDISNNQIRLTQEEIFYLFLQKLKLCDIPINRTVENENETIKANGVMLAPGFLYGEIAIDIESSICKDGDVLVVCSMKCKNFTYYGVYSQLKERFVQYNQGFSTAFLTLLQHGSPSPKTYKNCIYCHKTPLDTTADGWVYNFKTRKWVCGTCVHMRNNIHCEKCHRSVQPFENFSKWSGRRNERSAPDFLYTCPDCFKKEKI